MALETVSVRIDDARQNKIALQIDASPCPVIPDDPVGERQAASLHAVLGRQNESPLEVE